MSHTPTPSISIQRPLIDRRRSSSRERGVLAGRPAFSPTASPVGSPPQGASPIQRGILKQHVHPADQPPSPGGARGSSTPVGAGAAGAGGGLEASVSSLALDRPGSSSAGTDGTATLVGDGGSSRGRASFDSTAPPSTAGGGGRGAQFRRRVGFDTFEAGNDLEGLTKATGGGTGVTYSFTLSAKSSNYCRTRMSRTFLVATDLNEYSVNATDWLLTSFLEDNDEVVVLRVIEPGSSAHNAWKASMEEARDEAEGVLEYLMKKNGEEKQISLIVEFAIGPIEETIHRMIEIYKPDSLIVGTRGKPDSLFRSAMMGSISRWAVARSPVPVVVVRPDDKVREALFRRLQDPNRRSYVSLLSPDAQARNAALLSTSASSSGAPLERSITNPEAGDEGASERPSGGGVGSKIGWALGTKDDGGKKKKDKGKEFKRFGTFS